MADENNKKREIDAVEYTAKKTGKYDIEKNDAIKTRALKEEEIRKVKEEAMKPKKRWPRSFDATWSGLALNLLRNLVIVALAVVIVYFIGIKAYKYVYSHYVEPMDPESTEQIEVVIKKSESLKSISKKLEEAGIIRSATVFKYYVDFSDMSSKLLAGKFKLSPSMTYDDIINVLKRPSAAQTSTRVTLIEGITIKEMEDKLLQEAVLESTVNMDSRTMLGERYYADYWFIKEAMDRDRANTHHRTYMLEGYMFPDTYDFYISSDTDVAVKKMLNRFKEIYTEEYRKQVFSIFGGELQRVSLTFTQDMLSEMFDRFGSNIRIRKGPGDIYAVTVNVQISKPLFVWIVGTQGKVKIKSPHSVIDEFNAFVNTIKRAY